MEVDTVYIGIPFKRPRSGFPKADVYKKNKYLCTNRCDQVYGFELIVIQQSRVTPASDKRNLFWFVRTSPALTQFLLFGHFINCRLLTLSSPAIRSCSPFDHRPAGKCSILMSGSSSFAQVNIRK
jgi:hypothetical protein